MKLSEEYEKTSLPGQKNIYRAYMKSDRYVDIITTFDYLPDNNEFKCIDHITKKRYHIKPSFIESMLQPIDFDYIPTLEEAKKHCQKQLKEFHNVI